MSPYRQVSRVKADPENVLGRFWCGAFGVDHG